MAVEELGQGTVARAWASPNRPSASPCQCGSQGSDTGPRRVPWGEPVRDR
jgi:hypothetical protein